MKVPLRLIVLSLSVLGLAACASSMDRTTYVEPVRAMNPGEVSIEQDTAYIAYVERVARRRGIAVQWVHPPTKRVVASQ